MSATATATDATDHGHDHGHGGPGKDHVPHVLPYAAYFGVFIMLLIFTAITVGVSYIDLGHSVNLAIALIVATMKATMVGLIFMHLAFDKKFNLIVFFSSVLFLAVFIAFTMFDTEFRGLGGRILADRPADSTNPFAGSRHEAELRARWGAPAGGVEEKKEPGEGAKAPEAPAPAPAPTEGAAPAPTGGAPAPAEPAPAPH